MNAMQQIIIGADLVPTTTNIEQFASGDTATLLGDDLAELLAAASYRIFNLEVPLTDKAAPIPKCGPNLIAPTRTINGYKAMGVDLLTLANNHIMDQGAQGYESTISTLDAAGIAHVGGGDDLADAAKPYLFGFAGKRIGVYACAEHEFSIATETTCGANPFDPLESPDHVAKLKSECDFVIVLYHGGKEHYRYPSPNLQKTCRKLVEKGADLVICQHSHCIGCEEKYGDGTIVYGQGNFLFDHSKSEFWQTSLLVSLDNNLQASYIPLVKQGNGVRLADGVQAKAILQEFQERGHRILETGFIDREYKAFADSALADYLVSLGARRTLLGRILNRLSRGKYYKAKVKLLYRKRNYLALRNFIECEAHRELVLRGLCEDERDYKK